MSHILTASGAEYHLSGMASLDASARPVLMQDIAHQLSMLNRFHGATFRPYSVAEHSLLCSEIAQRDAQPLVVQLCALLHDAHEVYTQDVATAVKESVDRLAGRSGGTSAWSLFEVEHARRVRTHFGLLQAFRTHGAVVKGIDLIALATERRDLLNYEPGKHRPWSVLGDLYSEQRLRVEPLEWLSLATPEREALTWRDWRQAYLDRFDELTEGLEAEQLPA